MKRFLLLLIALPALGSTASACPLCNKEIRDTIYDSQFYPNLFIMLSAFIVLGIIVVMLSAITTKRHNTFTAANPTIRVLSPVPLTTAATVLGIGFGGFFDGIVFHQILQAHEMLSNKIPATTYVGKSVNMFWDGIFHAFCFIVSITGAVLLWKLMLRNDVDRSGRLLIAGLLFGWGTFNMVEGILDHQVLKLHNVIEYAVDHSIGNYTFLGVSLMMFIIGWMLVSRELKKRYIMP